MPTCKFTRKTLSHILLNIFCLHRSSRPEVLLRKGAPKICSKFTGEHPCRSAISIKLLCSFIEIAFWHGCSPVNLLHIFRTQKNPSGWLLLPSFSKNASWLLLPKRLWKCASKFFFRKYKQKVVLLVIYLFNYNSFKLTSSMLNVTFDVASGCLEYGFCK